MPSFHPPSATGKRKSDASNEIALHSGPNTPKRSRTSNENQPVSNESEHYWMVQWRNPQAKKHKTWEGDGVLAVNGSKATLYDSTDGKPIVSGKVDHPLFDGKLFNVGGKDLQLDRRMSKSEYTSGICFGSNVAVVAQPPDSTIPTIPRAEKPLLSPGPFAPPSLPQVPASHTDFDEKIGLAKANTSIHSSFWTVNWSISSSKKKQGTWEGDAFLSCVDQKITMVSEQGKVIGTCSCKGNQHRPGDCCFVGGRELVLLNEVSPSDIPSGLDEPEAPSLAADTPAIISATNQYIPPASFYAPIRAKKPVGPLHDPDAEGAVVMKAPTAEHIERFNKKDRRVVPVVLDPILAKRMRPHQHEGIKFMYESVMGLRKHEGQGCILADEMGLGKTLQTIGLIWTLLRQNPYAGAGPIASKVLIVCPVSLINNWKAEFHKWLGRDRIGVSVCDKNADAAKTFANSPRQQVLIVGYERLRTVMYVSRRVPQVLRKIGLVVCDEGHRLKSAKGKTSTIFKQLSTLRRVILSGTPIQNDLGEFHAMADFCNPGLLDEYSAFRRLYEVPILKSRAPGCTAKDLELGQKRSIQLSNIAKSFVLRREATILGNYLPPKRESPYLSTGKIIGNNHGIDEYVVFVTPTALQLSIFAKVLDPNQVDDLVETSSTAESLAMISTLTKISSSPILLKAAVDKDRVQNGDCGQRRANVQEALKLLPSNSQIEDLTLSGKMIALSKLLAAIKQETEEKCVLVSHYTSTLNILESYCKKMNYSYFRLDGQTPAAKRQEYVNTFNKTNQKTSFIFLLSSKAGGVGINLIGGSRLCLVDSDWNPSHDLQAMARCHRDGQKRPVFIYRFLTAGTIDEKIFQRQIIKLGLSNGESIISLQDDSKSKSKGDFFTHKDAHIFRIHPYTLSNTHDLLECICDKSDALEDTPEYSDEGTDSDPDSEWDTPKGFVTASQVEPNREVDKETRRYLENKKASLAALGEWKHTNCLKKDAQKEVKDILLQQMLYVKPKTDSMATPGTKTTDQILSALDNLAEMGDRTAQTVPGGTISFLFERSCSVHIESEDDVDNMEEHN
ncbi:hypothetical protein GYMLUDRAFT_153158 [Collybiopsis luxurians FD-317 M1]|nr:hypothetical protein GYMLUDRAFT_153158 [Collybiopsis luxurians FD-317 M1]